MPTPEPSSEIERAAAQHRARVAKAGGAPGHDAAEERVREGRRVQAHLVATALSAGRGDGALFAVVTLVGLAVPLGLWLTFLPGRNLWVFPASLASLLLAVGLNTVALRLVGARRAHRLTRIGHGFDAASYLELLGSKRRDGRLVVTLTFARPWTPAERALTVDAVKTWAPTLASTWVGPAGHEALALTSALLTTTAFTRPKTGSPRRYFTNGPVHEAFAAVLRQVVPPLHKANPVERLAVDVEGRVCPIDEAP